MEESDYYIRLAELADGEIPGPEMEAWLNAHPDEAAELEVARRVRALMVELRAAAIEVPVDFEARLMERVRGDITLLDLIELAFSALGRALVELLDIFFALLPATPAPQPAASPWS